jgi:hypothetical protein
LAVKDIKMGSKDAQLFLITAVRVHGAILVWLGASASPPVRAAYGVESVVVGVVEVSAAALAGVEVRGRYAERRIDATRRHARITRGALWLVWELAVVLLVASFPNDNRSCR